MMHYIIFSMIFSHRNRSRKRWDSPNRDFVRHVFWRLSPVAKKPRKKYSIHHFYRKWAKEYDRLFKKIILVSLAYRKCEKVENLVSIFDHIIFLDAFPVLKLVISQRIKGTQFIYWTHKHDELIKRFKSMRLLYPNYKNPDYTRFQCIIP